MCCLVKWMWSSRHNRSHPSIAISFHNLIFYCSVLIFHLIFFFLRLVVWHYAFIEKSSFAVVWFAKKRVGCYIAKLCDRFLGGVRALLPRYQRSRATDHGERLGISKKWRSRLYFNLSIQHRKRFKMRSSRKTSATLKGNSHKMINFWLGSYVTVIKNNPNLSNVRLCTKGNIAGVLCTLHR